MASITQKGKGRANVASAALCVTNRPGM